MDKVSYAYLGSHLSKLSKIIRTFFFFNENFVTISEKIVSNCSGEKVGLYVYVLIFLLQKIVFVKSKSCFFSNIRSNKGALTKPKPENIGIDKDFSHSLPK